MYSLFKFDTNACLLLGVIFLFLIRVAYLCSQTYKLRHIPSVGSSLPILSHSNAFRFLSHAKELIAEGSHNYPDGIFKVPDFLIWKVVVQGPKLIAEYRRVPEHVFSSRIAVESTLCLKHTFHPLVTVAPTYHIPIIRTQLTRSLATVTSEIYDEMVAAFDDYFPINNNAEWEPFPVFGIMAKIICRASNRVFVGLPLCRDPDLVTLLCKHTGDIAKTSNLLNFCPKFLHDFIAPFISEHRRQLETVQRLLAPLIETRRQEIMGKEDSTGQWTDLLTSLLRDPFGKTCADIDLTCRFLLSAFGSIHTTSITLTHALYDLATYPEYAEPLRQEAASLVESDGWTKVTINKMDKMDSFLKESMRLNTFFELTMARVALEDYTFSQTGTFIPKGTFLNVATHEAHFDADIYPDPATFDGFRFYKMKSQAAGGNERHFDMTTTSTDSLAFGSGVHACPGRFFAANTMKLILAHVVLNYDIKFENGRLDRPLNKRFKGRCIPDPTIKLLFRKRKN